MGTVIENRFEDIMMKLTDIFLSDSNVLFALLFGSYARKKERERDLDVAIYFKKQLEGIDLLFFINKLSNLIGKEVDLVVLNDASAFLRHQVMKYGIPVTIKDRGIYRGFREKTISDYDEYKYVSGMYAYDR